MDATGMSYDPAMSLPGKTGGRPSSSMGGSGMMKGTRSTAFGLEETEADYSQVPIDILPPAPRQVQQKFIHVPFLFTSLAKEAFQTSSKNGVPRPDSDAFGQTRGTSAGSFGQTRGTSRGLGSLPTSPNTEHRGTRKGHMNDDDGVGGGGGRKSSMSGRGDGLGLSLSRMGTESRGSGRLSAPPMSNYGDKSLLSTKRTMGSTKGSSKLGKKRPEIFVLEAEQRALEAEQKAIERETFETRKAEAEMHIMNLAKMYNQLKNKRLGLEKEHSTMLERKNEIAQDSMTQDMRRAQADMLRKQDLEAKYEYWTEALHEEESYSKTLTHMQARSAEEKHQRDNGTAKFMQETKNYDHDLHALLVRLQDAKNERDAAEHQVHDYWEEMNVYRERREARLDERKRIVHKLQLKQEALKRLLAEEEEVNRLKNAKNLEAGNDAMAQARAKERFRQRIEEGFQKVMSVTGIQTVEELEEGFVNREKRTSQLEQMLEGNKNRINDLTDVKQELDLELLKVKFSGSANDADRDEVADIMQKLADIRLQVAEKVSKVNATEGVLIKARGGLEYLWKKLEALELPEGFGEGEDDGEEAGGEEVGGEGKDDGGGGDGESRGGEGSNEESRDDEGEAREGDEAGQAGSEAGGGDDDDGDQSLREAMGSTAPSNLNASIVGDGKTGVIPIMRMCHKKLCAIYSFLEQNTAGVPYQRIEDAEEVRVSESLLLGLTDLHNNTRIPVGDLKPKRSPRKHNNEDDGTEVEDRGTVKSKADRLVAKKKKEIAGRFDEFGNEILQPPPAAKPALGKSKR